MSPSHQQLISLRYGGQIGKPFEFRKKRGRAVLFLIENDIAIVIARQKLRARSAAAAPPTPTTSSGHNAPNYTRYTLN
jgi:hypothetical protein